MSSASHLPTQRRVVMNIGDEKYTKIIRTKLTDGNIYHYYTNDNVNNIKIGTYSDAIIGDARGPDYDAPAKIGNDNIENIKAIYLKQYGGATCKSIRKNPKKKTRRHCRKSIRRR